MSREGSVKKDGSGRWSFRVDVTPAGASRKQVHRRGFKTKAEALDALDEVKRQVHGGTFVEPTKQTVGQYLKEWLVTIEPTVRPSTHHSYDRNMRVHVIPAIGDVPLQSVDGGTLNRLYADLLATGNKGHRAGEGLAPRSVAYIHTVIHRAFKDAVRWSRLTRNPADAADPPKPSSAHAAMVTWTADEVADFLDRCRSYGDRHWPLWTLLATTGMRRGEALGLRWSDVDLDTGIASVSQTVIAVKHETRFGSPKTAHGVRTVDLDERTVMAFRDQRRTQLEERLAIGSGWRDHDLIFCKVDGDPLHPERVSREFQRRIERWNLRPITLHGIRHTWATLALRAGVHPKVVQERLGHATIGITLGTYSHVQAGMQRDAAEQVAGMIFGQPLA